MSNTLPKLGKVYVQWGADGHLHEVADQKSAEELYKKQLHKMFGRESFGKDCYGWVKKQK